MIENILPSDWSPFLLSLLRIVVGLLFLSHGLSKLFAFPASTPPAARVPVASLMGVAGLIEAVGGILITIGLFTKFAAFISSGEMAVAYFMFHAKNSFYPIKNGGEAAIMFCFVFLFIAAAGAGPISLDALLR